MSENNIEVFTTEFRHEIVEKFVKDLTKGKIRLMIAITDSNSDLTNTITRTYVNLTKIL